MNSPSTKPFLGLSLCPDQICLVETEDGTIQTVAYRELVRSFDLETFRREGEFFDNQTEVLRDLFQRTGGEGREVGVVLHGGMVLVKKIPLALGLEEESVRGQIVWEAEQFLVAPSEDYIMEYQRLPFQTPEGNPIYLMVLVRKSVVEGVRSLVEEIGLDLKELDVDMFSNIRALLANYDLTLEGTSALVDIQREHLAIVFIRRLEYYLSHRVFLQKGGSVSGLGDSSDIVHLLLKELRRLVFGHRLGGGIEDLDRIFLVGSEVVQRVFEELSSTVSVPVEIVNPFRRVNVSSSISQSRGVVQFPERFVASVGVTLRRVSTLAE